MVLVLGLNACKARSVHDILGTIVNLQMTLVSITATPQGYLKGEENPQEQKCGLRSVLILIS